MFPADGIAGVPRRPRTGVRKRGGDCWSEVVKRAKLAINGNPGPTPRRQRHRQAVAAEQETEQEVAEALFNLASGGVGSSYQAEQAGERVKTEEPLPRNRTGSHGGRGQGRGNGDRRKQPREVEEARQWATTDATNVQGHIATPKAVKPSTNSAAVGPSMPLPALPASGGANIGLGMGLGAFAGTFANGLNGSYYSPSAANASAAAQAAAAAQAQSALWPPSFPGQGREEAGKPSSSGQEVLMPPQRRNWKRCASHVYIAHFIEYQIHKDRLQKQQRQALRALGADAAASPDLLRANGAAAATPPDAAGRSPATEAHNVAATSAAAAQPLPLLNGSQAMANGAYQFSQPASAPLAAAGLGRPGQQNGFPPQFAQQLQNHLLLQQSGAFPFLPPGMQHLGGQFLGGANGGLTPQQAAALQQASSFPFPASAHMLGLAGFGNLSQQLNGANGLGGGFGPRKIDIKDGLSGDVAALKRAAAVSGMKPEDVLKLGLPSMTTPEAAARLHALGVPSAMLNGRQPPTGVPPAMTMAGFHEQLLAAAAQQRPESQGISLLR